MLKDYYDHHVHTESSPDAEATLVGYLEAGHRDLMITDHVDLGSPDPLFDTWADYDRLFEEVKVLERRYDARIRIGVEMGYQVEQLDALEAFVASYPFSFVIGSIHFGDGLDFYNGDFFIGKSQQEAYRRYFELVLDMVTRFKSFDVVGHLDYITRYGPYSDKVYHYEDHREVIDEILVKLVEQGRGMEINTSGMRNALQVFHPMEAVVRRYAALGGKIITLGSDAHYVKDYGAHFDAALPYLRSCGISEVTRFEDRKSIQLPF